MTESRFNSKQSTKRRQTSLEVNEDDEEAASLLQTTSTDINGTCDTLTLVANDGGDKVSVAANNSSSSSGISSMGLKVLILLAVQNSSKNLLMRYVMKEKPNFLTSAAVIGSECTKLTLSILYILLVERKSFDSIVQYFKDDWRNTLLVSVPASAYNLQMTLEYIALANLDAAMFSVLVQTKLLFTATFAALVIGKKLKYIQVISLVLLTVGVMLCNMRFGDDAKNSNLKGILATLGIAVSSGFASVYTEKVIKTQRQKSPLVSGQYGLAYTQVQLASMSLVTIGIYACLMDFSTIMQYGLFHNFNGGAFLTVFNSAIGGLIVAGVLKYADSVLKGYATAISVIMTGLFSMMLFGTHLHAVYFMGIANVVIAVLLYNGKNLEEFVCS
ncbi:UDP-galactose transporter [Nitzschia inconspicua]|uniref:UDP-galactose transporter n=1 Tax=Nitzschia inconspicua TaxID=303405 RepID=A0A9K3PBJ8_9STRA|nr:UDP-galactose transporter [Nitzschia inconspicua]